MFSLRSLQRRGHWKEWRSSCWTITSAIASPRLLARALRWRMRRSPKSRTRLRGSSEAEGREATPPALRQLLGAWLVAAVELGRTLATRWSATSRRPAASDIAPCPRDWELTTMHPFPLRMEGRLHRSTTREEPGCAEEPLKRAGPGEVAPNECDHDERGDHHGAHCHSLGPAVPALRSDDSEDPDVQDVQGEGQLAYGGERPEHP